MTISTATEETTHPQGMTMHPPLTLPRLQRNTPYPPHIKMWSRGRAHTFYGCVPTYSLSTTTYYYYLLLIG